eukprot:4357997-Pyramimonas_sp.AAC.1
MALRRPRIQPQRGPRRRESQDGPTDPEEVPETVHIGPQDGLRRRQTARQHPTVAQESPH